jgi:hypothetical protein
MLGLHKRGKGYKLGPSPLSICENNWLNPSTSLSEAKKIVAFASALTFSSFCVVHFSSFFANKTLISHFFSLWVFKSPNDVSDVIPC